MNKILIGLLCCCAIFALSTCGGGGGGGGSGGQQSVLKVVNSTTDADTIAVDVDGEAFFDSIVAGQASVFKEILAGDRMLLISESNGAQRTLELQNEFAFGIPYTIVVTESDSRLLPIVALNDRSDTPPAQFRIRAMNASNRAGSIRVRLVPGTIGRNSRNSLLLRAATPILEATSNENSLATPAPTSTATPVATASPQAGPPQNVTPTVTPIAEISATATPVSSETPQQVTAVTVAQNLNFQGQGEYIVVPQSDYRIVVEASGTAPATSGVITFSGGQIITIVIRDQSTNEGAGTAILRLDDNP